MFELDKKLLQAHAMPYVAAYTWETGTLIRALDMDEFLPPRTGGVPEEELRLRSARVPRRQQRKMRCVHRTACRLLACHKQASESSLDNGPSCKR